MAFIFKIISEAIARRAYAKGNNKKKSDDYNYCTS